jgi:iron complex transport system substrate-binding protein
MRISIYRILCLILLSIFTVSLVAACNIVTDSRIVTQKPSDCRVVQHELGNTCIPRNPQRIVTLWIGSLSSAWALGVNPIASTWMPNEPFPDYLEGGNRIEYIGTLAQPNLEKILLLKPDLIISNTRLQSIHHRLSHIAPTIVASLSSPPPSWQQNLENVAKLLGKELEGQQLIDHYWQRVEKLKQVINEQRHQLTVSVITIDPPYGIFTYGKQHPTGKLLDDIGLQRPPMQTGDFFTKDQVSQELLPEADGDVIFVSYRGGEAAKEAFNKLQQNSLWQTLKAVQRNRVYTVDSDHWYAFDVLAMNAVLDDIEKYLVNAPL